MIPQSKPQPLPLQLELNLQTHVRTHLQVQTGLWIGHGWLPWFADLHETRHRRGAGTGGNRPKLAGGNLFCVLAGKEWASSSIVQVSRYEVQIDGKLCIRFASG